jgi:hypothetical protein
VGPPLVPLQLRHLVDHSFKLSFEVEMRRFEKPRLR